MGGRPRLTRRRRRPGSNANITAIRSTRTPSLQRLFHRSLKAPIAMGYVTPGLAATGSAVEVEVRGKKQPATVAKMPWVPHAYYKPAAAAAKA
jgi:hypothetical protein